MTSDCTIVTPSHKGSVRRTIVLPGKLAIGSIHDYLYCYCPLVGILFEVLRIECCIHFSSYGSSSLAFFSVHWLLDRRSSRLELESSYTILCIHFWTHSVANMSVWQQKYHIRGQYWKLLRTNILPVQPRLTSASNHLDCLLIALSIKTAMFVIFPTCWLKVTLSSMTIPQGTTVFEGKMTILSRRIHNSVWGILMWKKCIETWLGFLSCYVYQTIQVFSLFQSLMQILPHLI